MTRPTLTLAVLVGVLAMGSQAQAISDGFYLSLGIGYGSVSGDRGVLMGYTGACEKHEGDQTKVILWAESNGCFMLPASPQSQEIYAEMVRTDFGSGFAAQIRLGYTIEGIVSPELVFAGHGSTEGPQGLGHLGLRARYHPAQHWVDHEDRPWDASLFYGMGLSIGGYHHEDLLANVDTGKGWEGTHHSFGLTGEYQGSDVVSFGVDLAWFLPRYEFWIVNYDDNVRTVPESPPDTTAFAFIVHTTFRP